MSPFVLVVDPNAERGQQLVAACEQVGAAATLCLDGDEALLLLRARPHVDVLCTQFSIPKLEGAEFLKLYRERFSAASGARLVVLSSFTELRDAATALRASLGIDAVLSNTAIQQSLPRVLATLLAGATAQMDRAALSPPTPPSDAARAEKERTMQLAYQSNRLDRVPISPPDGALQSVVAGVASRCGAGIAMAGLAVKDKLIFPARHGLALLETDRYSALCNLVIDAEEPLFVPDAQKSEAFRSHAAVQAGIVRGYASVPLRLRSGVTIGTLAVINSSSPLRLEVSQLRFVREAAREIGARLSSWS